MRRAIGLFSLLAVTVHAAASARNGATCSNSASTAFFVVDNAILQTNESVVISEVSEEECQSTCSTNLNPSGKSLPCSAFAYDHLSFTCTVYPEKAFPEGEHRTTQTVGKRYFEKFCLPEVMSTSCSEAQFIRVDDSVLIGFAANVSLVDSLQECVATCVLEKACKSAMYFYEEGECITNTESALTRPSSFAREDTEKVIYFQNGCLARSDFVESTITVGPVSEVDSDAKKKKMSDSAELPLSEELEEHLDEETKPTTTGVPSTTTTEQITKKQKKTSNVPSATTEKEETLDEEEDDQGIYDDEEEAEEDEEELNTTTASAPEKKKGGKGKGVPEDLKKYEKHPKNFGSKTVHYKHKKGEKIGIPRVASSAEEVEAAESGSDEESDEGAATTHSSDPYTAFFSAWSDWTPCKTSGERRIRRRKCLDLRRCLGALMQVENCPAATAAPAQPDQKQEELKSEKSIVTAEGETLAGAFSTSPASPIDAQIAEAGTDIGDGFIWSPWLGACQKFASGQPCNNNEMIGFESRECVAKDPSKCQGPFFRYCTLPC